MKRGYRAGAGTVHVYEVVEVLLRERGKPEADRLISEALRRIVVPLSEELALAAARASNEMKLPMADAIIYTTTQAYQAQLVTGDVAFRGLRGVIIP